VMHHCQIKKLDFILCDHDFGKYSRNKRNELISICKGWLAADAHMIQMGNITPGISSSFKKIFNIVRHKWIWDSTVFPQKILFATK
jgi:hypothetical protein